MKQAVVRCKTCEKALILVNSKKGAKAYLNLGIKCANNAKTYGFDYDEINKEIANHINQGHEVEVN